MMEARGGVAGQGLEDFFSVRSRRLGDTTLVGLLQERYGYSREKVEEELERLTAV
jgi:hypothetical protein